MKKSYQDCSRNGLEKKLPKIDVWKNQFKDYTITITYPEFNTVCPLTNLPDIGTIKIIYTPDKFCVEMKSLKLYFIAYRNLGIFQENTVNKILKDFVKYVKPINVEIVGEFNPRGGMLSEIRASYRKKSKSA